ncbi:unnamed protein product [Withania somnifera]
MSANLPNSNLEICNVISESKRIVSSQKRHFTALSLLLLFPLSIFTILFVTFGKTTIISFIFALFAIIVSFCAVATITYTSFQGYNGQSIDLSSIILSIFPLFLPLLSTFILLLAITCTCLGLLLILIYKGVLLMGFDMHLSSFHFIILYLSIMIVVGVYLGMKWMLVNVIVVVEGKRCYEPLRRSAYLMKELKWGQFCRLCLWYWATIWPAAHTAGRSKWLDNLSFAVLLVYYSGFLTLWLLHSLVRNVVLYVQCKALCGEFLQDLPL